MSQPFISTLRFLWVIEITLLYDVIPFSLPLRLEIVQHTDVNSLIKIINVLIFLIITLIYIFFLSILWQQFSVQTIVIVSACFRCINGSTLLHTAAYFGCVEVIETLLQENLDVNLLDYKGATAIHRASNTETMRVRSYCLIRILCIYNRKGPTKKTENKYCGCIMCQILLQMNRLEICWKCDLTTSNTLKWDGS